MLSAHGQVWCSFSPSVQHPVPMCYLSPEAAVSALCDGYLLQHMEQVVRLTAMLIRKVPWLQRTLRC